MSFSHALLRGYLHTFVAFDWGDSIDLEYASRLLPAETHDLARRRRTPQSIAYRPPPLRYPLGEVPLTLPGWEEFRASAEAIAFDFGGVSVSLQTKFELSPQELSRLAATLADAQPMLEAARKAAESLFARLQPAIYRSQWGTLGEEFFVFQIPPEGDLPLPEQLLEEHADWLASLVRLDTGPLSRDEIAAALQQRISYSPHDLLVADWSAAVLIDRDCEESLQVIEFANMQLLEYRHLDNLLDDQLDAAYATLRRTTRRWFPFWRTHGQSLRKLGQVRLDVTSLFERTSNALKLVGDQYLARVYRLIAGRFHLTDWESSIRNSLDVVEGSYQVLSDQGAMIRIELLEIIVILLIATEILMAIL